jgi:hypothetical protein
MDRRQFGLPNSRLHVGKRLPPFKDVLSPIFPIYFPSIVLTYVSRYLDDTKIKLNGMGESVCTGFV